jgi:thioredoxin reductase (NADPH)
MWDAVIIGAGPAGLTAAIYLGRFHRKVLVIDGGASRARWIPESHNIPGFCYGIAGNELLDKMMTQARSYGAEVHCGRVERVSVSTGVFQTQVGTEVSQSRYLLLATGVNDHLPAIGGAEEAILRSRLRICPICDAFEATGKDIAVIGDGEHAEREAEFLTTYSDRITLLHIGRKRGVPAMERLAQRGIQVVETTLEAIELTDDCWRLRLPDRQIRTFDVCYAALGCSPRNELAVALGAGVDRSNALVVNAHQETSVSNLYAAGDVVRGLNQVIVAAAEAAIAATDIHNKLRESLHVLGAPADGVQA